MTPEEQIKSLQNEVNCLKREIKVKRETNFIEKGYTDFIEEGYTKLLHNLFFACARCRAEYELFNDDEPEKERFFHYHQALFRLIEKSGLARDYRDAMQDFIEETKEKKKWNDK